VEVHVILHAHAEQSGASEARRVRLNARGSGRRLCDHGRRADGARTRSRACCLTAASGSCCWSPRALSSCSPAFIGGTGVVAPDCQPPPAAGHRAEASVAAACSAHLTRARASVLPGAAQAAGVAPGELGRAPRRREARGGQRPWLRLQLRRAPTRQPRRCPAAFEQRPPPRGLGSTQQYCPGQNPVQ
jgi:hypothetical protein